MERINIGAGLCIAGNVVSIIGVMVSGASICVLGNFISLVGIAMFGTSFKKCFELLKIQDELIKRFEFKSGVDISMKWNDYPSDSLYLWNGDVLYVATEDQQNILEEDEAKGYKDSWVVDMYSITEEVPQGGQWMEKEYIRDIGYTIRDVIDRLGRCDLWEDKWQVLEPSVGSTMQDLFANNEFKSITIKELKEKTKKLDEKLNKGKVEYEFEFSPETSSEFSSDDVYNQLLIEKQRVAANMCLKMEGHCFLKDYLDGFGITDDTISPNLGWSLRTNDEYCYILSKCIVRESDGVTIYKMFVRCSEID